MSKIKYFLFFLIMILLGAGFLIGCRQGEDHSASVRKEETTTGTAGESKEKTAVRADGESKEKTTDAQEGTSAEKEGTAVTQDSKKALSDTDFSLGIKVISMFTGDLVNIPLTIMDQAADGSETAFRWENQQPDIVEVRSDGTNFHIHVTEEQLQERLWETQIKVIFPFIEKHRNRSRRSHGFRYCYLLVRIGFGNFTHI